MGASERSLDDSLYGTYTTYNEYIDHNYMRKFISVKATNQLPTADRFYLVLTTSLVKWLVNIYCMCKKYDDVKKREYLVEIDDTYRYRVHIRYLYNSKFESKILLNNKVIVSTFFDNPIDLCTQLFNMKEPQVSRFVQLLITNR